MSDKEKTSENFNNSSMPIGGNKTPDPHPKHTERQIPSKAQIGSLKDIATQVSEDKNVPSIDASYQELPGAKELKTFHAEHDLPNTDVAYKSHKPSLNIKLAGLVVLIVLVLGFAGFSLYEGDLYWARDMVGLGLPSNPEEAIERVFSNTDALDSAKTKLNFELSAGFGDYEFAIALSSEIEVDAKNKKEKAILNIDKLEYPDALVGEYAKEYENLATSIKENVSNVEILSFEKDSEGYFKIPSINDKWFRVDSSYYSDLIDMENIVKMTKTDRASSFNTLLAAVSYADQSSDSVISTNYYLKDIRKEADETLDGERTYHYSAVFDAEKAFEEHFTANTYFDSRIDFWISKKALVFTNVEIELTLKDLPEFEGFEVYGSLTLGLDINNYNEPVSIDKPSDYEELTEDVLEDLIAGKELKTSIIDARNAQRETDIAQITTALEQYYKDNNKYPIADIKSSENSFLSDLSDDYLVSVPKDPSGPDYYYHYRSDNGEDYTLNYILETKDSYDVKSKESS